MDVFLFPLYCLVAAVVGSLIGVIILFAIAPVFVAIIVALLSVFNVEVKFASRTNAVLWWLLFLIFAVWLLGPLTSVSPLRYGWMNIMIRGVIVAAVLAPPHYLLWHMWRAS